MHECMFDETVYHRLIAKMQSPIRAIYVSLSRIARESFIVLYKYMRVDIDDVLCVSLHNHLFKIRSGEKLLKFTRKWNKIKFIGGHLVYFQSFYHLFIKNTSKSFNLLPRSCISCSATWFFSPKTWKLSCGHSQIRHDFKWFAIKLCILCVSKRWPS